ncbi:MAG: hypothetical protein RQ826_17135 [Xanthomonadales bacterium]|nr:hypothetical protein [Xanthomonadales bacterium]
MHPAVLDRAADQGKFFLPEVPSFPRRWESRIFNPMHGLANPAVLLELDFRFRGNDWNSGNLA